MTWCPLVASNSTGCAVLRQLCLLDYYMHTVRTELAVQPETALASRQRS